MWQVRAAGLLGGSSVAAGAYGAKPAPKPKPPPKPPKPAAKPEGEAVRKFPQTTARATFLVGSAKTYAATGEGLRDAIKAGDLNGVQDVLARDSSLASYQDRQTESMLHLAALFDHAAIALALAAPRAIATDGAADPVIGVDLGTTYSCVGVFQNGAVEIIANDQGNRVTPSYVAFTESERLVGDAAKNQAAMNPTNTVFDAKRLIGRKFTDPAAQSDMKHWPFKVISGPAQKPMIEVVFKGETKQFASEEISSMVLIKMKEIAEAYLGTVHGVC